MNSIRLGTYQTIDNYGWNRYESGELNPGLCILWGGFAGCLGSTVGCPLYMVKTQIQAQSYGKYAVGFQHGYKRLKIKKFFYYLSSLISHMWMKSCGNL